ncbi:MAG: DEAD/DEAH box helicase family protein [Brevinema sp.]
MFLHEKYNEYSKDGIFEEKDFYNCDHLAQNLNPKFELRPYQKEAYARLQYYFFQKHRQQNNTNTHLMFNMATGSGKTLVMAMFILDLYQKGYRNFLFFVDSTNIVEKTKHNFLNSVSSKYLFADKITIDNKLVSIKAVSNFEAVNQDDINICFTTVQGLASTLTTEKENSITYDDFKDKKIVMLADEAHHLNSNTKTEAELFNSWEYQIMKIFNSNNENILLEFTATVPKIKEILEKYEDKLIYKYDLKEFRNDKYSKELNLIKTDASLEDRMLIACLMNYYRLQVAMNHQLNIKPVVLFKSETKVSSETNHKLFNGMIDSINEKKIDKILDSGVLSTIKGYVKANNITSQAIVSYLKQTFKPEHLINMNNDAEKQKNQLLVNSLEDSNNPICGIFAVEKLNEGWDVLNLYDIVRCYTTKTDLKETTKEAQLIGRGARYYPFPMDETQDKKYKRKYDDHINNPLRILEEFHYHAQNESAYIKNLTASLQEEGLFDEKPKKQVKMSLKADFVNSDIYNNGFILINKSEKKADGLFDTTRFEELPSVKAPILLSEINSIVIGSETHLLDNNSQSDNKTKEMTPIRKNLLDFGISIIKKALSMHEFYSFESLKQWLPEIKSTNDFIEKYLKKVKIECQSDLAWEDISITQKLNMVNEALATLTPEINRELQEEVGSEFFEKMINQVFLPEKIRETSEDVQEHDDLLKPLSWYVYDKSIFTSEETSLIKLFKTFMDKLQKKYTDTYLLRNERFFALFNKNGQRFEPDFVLVCKNKDEQEVLYQCFIEPKGAHLLQKDQWKEEFLQNSFSKQPIITKSNRKYKLIGLPFYNRIDGIGENKFEEMLDRVFEV